LSFTEIEAYKEFNTIRENSKESQISSIITIVKYLLSLQS